KLKHGVHTGAPSVTRWLPPAPARVASSAAAGRRGPRAPPRPPPPRNRAPAPGAPPPAGWAPGGGGAPGPRTSARRRPPPRAAHAGGIETHVVADAAQAVALVAPLVRPGDAVLVKASRALGLERVADGLLARAADARHEARQDCPGGGRP